MDHRITEKSTEKKNKIRIYIYSEIVIFLSCSFVFFLCVLCDFVVSILLPREFDGARFADDRDLDFAGIVQLLLDRLGDVVADLDGVAV